MYVYVCVYVCMYVWMNWFRRGRGGDKAHYYIMIRKIIVRSNYSNHSSLLVIAWEVWNKVPSLVKELQLRWDNVMLIPTIDKVV